MTLAELGLILLFVLGMVASAFALDASFGWVLSYLACLPPRTKKEKK